MDEILQFALPETLAVAIATAAMSEGKTVDQIAAEAIQRDLARRTLQRLRREAELRAGDASDAAVNELVEQAVQEVRRTTLPVSQR